MVERETGVAGPRYRAFISYSRRDAAFGKRLHARLEAYRLPRRLVGRTGAITARLTPIFRDREELPAADDLSAQVRSALVASDSLIVVCSPAAKASPWVAREIETFRALHPDRPVLAALASGEPADAFPKPLMRAGADGVVREPLAADFRPIGDGPRAGLLKLVAGVAGVRLDELVQRDAQRRVRRVTAVTAVSVVVALAMGAMTAVALQARTEADRQRNEAEGLTDFMQTDLRTKLKEVDRLDIMIDVNKRAFRYYDHQNLDALPAESLERRARILHAMGEDDEARGDIHAAYAEFVDANQTTSRLLAQQPNNAGRIFDQAQSEYWLAFIAWRIGRIGEARAGFERYAALTRRLLAIDPKKPEWLKEAGDAESNLGMLEMRENGAAIAAHKLFARAQAYFEAAAAREPTDLDLKSDLADGDAWLADSADGAGDKRSARESRLQQRAILEEMIAANPRDMQPRNDLLGNDLALAALEMESEDYAAADRRLVLAIEQADALSRRDPDDMTLVKQRRMLELTRAKNAILADNRQHLHLALALLAECKGQADRSEAEIADFCLILKNRALSKAGGHHNFPSSTQLGEIRSKWLHVRRSPHWGINFEHELAHAHAN